MKVGVHVSRVLLFAVNTVYFYTEMQRSLLPAHLLVVTSFFTLCALVCITRTSLKWLISFIYRP